MARLRRPFPLRARQRGQVLLFVAMLLVVLLVMCFFLFDLHQVIKLRMKTQNGADAAALTGAAWQGRTLNTIGELNLIKGATLILYQIPPYPDDGDPATDELLDSVDLLSSMQERLTYVGPLLGFAALQQSAKNNGLRNVGEYSGRVYSHVNRWLDVQNGSLYESIYGSDPLGLGFNWTNPYANMLEDIAGRGVAAMPFNQRYLQGGGELTGPGSDLLMDPEFYAAVYARDYCWFYRRGLTSDSPPIDLDGIRYGENPSAWFSGSEYLPLYVNFSTAGDPTMMASLQAERGWTPLPADYPRLQEITWATYDTQTARGWGDSSLYDQYDQYLRTSVKSEYAFEGACVALESGTSPALITGAWRWEYGSPPPAQGDTLGDAFAKSYYNDPQGHRVRGPVRPGSITDNAQQVARAERRLANLRNNQSIHSTAAAKAFGSLGDLPPQASGMVLPVFTEVRLIPTMFVHQNLADRNPRFYQFIVDYFGHPDYPNVPEDIVNRYSYYLLAIEMYNDMTGNFREGWAAAEDYWQSVIDAGRRHPCSPLIFGGPGGGGSRGGPPSLH